MPLVINEEQLMLKNSAKEFCKSKSPVEALRKLRDEKNPMGFESNVWKEMTEMGWSSLTIPEAYGGLDFGYTGLGQILEETGRTLTASPLVSTVLLGTTTLLLAGSENQKATLLPAIASGESTISLGFNEKNIHAPFYINTSATKKDDSFVLNGKKVFVLDGHTADYIIVTARTSDASVDKNGISLFLVNTKDKNIRIEKTAMMDSRNAANIHFNNVVLSSDNLIGQLDEGGIILEKVLDIARIGLSAEMLGSMQEAFDRTISYLKERRQFGVPIGSFQALQHRAAKMYGEIELCKSLVLKSLQAIDKKSNNLSLLASMTKAKVGSTLQLITNEGVQLFGGIGMTDDEEIGFFLKRARVAQRTFGDSNYHLNRYAELNGY